jgi:hypothetical protein
MPIKGLKKNSKKKSLKKNSRKKNLKRSSRKKSSKKNNFIMFTEQQRKDIMKSYQDIINNKITCRKQNSEKVKEGSKGMHIYPTIKDNQNALCDNIERAKKEKKHPIVHEDSMTSWCNQAAEQYGLEIRDILKLKEGDQLKVILMDRNIGDYTHGTKKGTKIDPRKRGLVYGLYTHHKKLCGEMKFYENGNDVGTDKHYLDRKFMWEINSAGCSSCFWNVVPYSKTKSGKAKFIDITELDPKTKVGFRGPSIEFKDAKYLPKKVKHYGTWWDDYSPFRTHNFLNVKRIKK